MDDDYNITDCSQELLRAAQEDCAAFQAAHSEDIASDLGLAGHDFWLTRNGHGAGFEDGHWREGLACGARGYGGVNLFVGIDGLIHS